MGQSLCVSTEEKMVYFKPRCSNNRGQNLSLLRIQRRSKTLASSIRVTSKFTIVCFLGPLHPGITVKYFAVSMIFFNSGLSLKTEVLHLFFLYQLVDDSLPTPTLSKANYTSHLLAIDVSIATCLVETVILC